MPDASEQAGVLALVAAAPLAWHWAGALVEEAGGARRLLAGDGGEDSPLVLRRSWAKQYAAHPGVLVVDGVEAVLAAVAAIARQRAGTAGDAAALTARRR
jgi:hypothetical protein